MLKGPAGTPLAPYIELISLLERFLPPKNAPLSNASNSSVKSYKAPPFIPFAPNDQYPVSN
jgi:hypothetical protein